MFIQFILLPLLLLQFLCTSASRYGAYCTSDSDCDEHQKCIERVCRCNTGERRFWTGEICAVCVIGFLVTYDRCYKSFDELKTWTDARTYCHARYADLFTWRNNADEQFIRPVIQLWSSASVFTYTLTQLSKQTPTHPYIAWAGAIITSLNPHTTKWMDPDGIKLDLYSSEWCDPTKHAGYVLPREPSSGSRQSPNGTEREECVTYNFGTAGTSLLCLADDYCSQKYPFICEMNAASMKLANSALHGTDDDNINFEEQLPTPSPADSGPINIPSNSEIIVSPSQSGINPGNVHSPSALAKKSGALSMANVAIFLIVGIILVIGAITGYIFLKKKKEGTDDHISNNGDVSQDRPSFTASVGNMMDE